PAEVLEKSSQVVAAHGQRLPVQRSPGEVRNQRFKQVNSLLITDSRLFVLTEPMSEIGYPESCYRSDCPRPFVFTLLGRKGLPALQGPLKKPPSHPARAGAWTGAPVRSRNRSLP